MTAEKLAGILQNQMPAADKIARAAIVLDTDLPIADTKSQLDAWLKSLGLKSLGIGKSGSG
jgi:dephospho-CoA kinase